MAGDLLNTQVDEIRKLLESQLRIRAKTLDLQVRKAGRLLPRNLRRDATYLAQAATVMHHPKLSRMIDETKAQQAHARLKNFLVGVDPKDRARGKLLGWLGSIAFMLIVVFVVAVAVLVKRGIV